MRQRILRVAVFATWLFITSAVWAWGPDGHHTVGAIADKLLAGTHAAQQVKQLLGGLSLQDAAVWADCAKGVDPKKDYAYTTAGHYPECKIFETPEGEAAMADFVRRNDTNCPRRPSDESCHRQYHYTDEAIQRDRYVPGSVGTRNFDIVAAVRAAMLVLKGQPVPAPFVIKGKREALLLLAHYVGDIHQPLHVGAIYLDAHGARLDPDTSGFDSSTDTRGGNDIATINPTTERHGGNLHQTWDDVPRSLESDRIDAAWLNLARRVPSTKGKVVDWSAAWASETLLQARAAFVTLKFSAEVDHEWTANLSCSYEQAMKPLKKTQLTRAGARLAQTLNAIWP